VKKREEHENRKKERALKRQYDKEHKEKKEHHHHEKPKKEHHHHEKPKKEHHHHEKPKKEHHHHEKPEKEHHPHPEKDVPSEPGGWLYINFHNNDALAGIHPPMPLNTGVAVIDATTIDYFSIRDVDLKWFSFNASDARLGIN